MRFRCFRALLDRRLASNLVAYLASQRLGATSTEVRSIDPSRGYQTLVQVARHYDIRTPAMSYHKFNEIARRDLVLERLRRGEVLALISDAGMPGISDPGSDIVRACVEANVDVFPIPLPSAVVTALVASGLPTEEFSFVGFLPAQATSRHKRLTIAAKESATQVFYVPPHKLLKILDDCISTFGPSCPPGDGVQLRES